MNSIKTYKHPNIWRPFTQMKFGEAVKVTGGEGAFLILEDGRRIFDAISSWWVNAHGHANPYIADAIARQAKTLEHVIFTQFSHAPAEILAERLCEKLGAPYQKIFFSDDGSTAVEVALKMALQYYQNLGENRSQFIALEDGYHGDTFGAMAVSGRSIFTRPFEECLTGVRFVPRPTEENFMEVRNSFVSLLQEVKPAAFIFEPILQGAAGMRPYPAKFLDEMIALAKAHDVLTIADEVMTGFYRTGTFCAVHLCARRPDFICLSKALTGGFLPMGVTATTDKIFDAFLDSNRLKTFFHGHSYTANPIACAAANASLDLFEQNETLNNIQTIIEFTKKAANKLQNFEQIESVRHCGIVLAFDITATANEISAAGWEENIFSGYLNPVGGALAKAAFDEGIFLRPLGNVVYWLPPYCTKAKTLNHTLSFLINYIEKL